MDSKECKLITMLQRIVYSTKKKWWQVYCSFSRKIYKEEEKTTKIEDSESVKIGRPSKGKLQ